MARTTCLVEGATQMRAAMRRAMNTALWSRPSSGLSLDPEALDGRPTSPFGKTPAMAAGVTNEFWTLEERYDKAMA